MSLLGLKFTQRKIKKGYRSSRGYFPSVKNSKTIDYESKLESSLFFSLEFDDDVAYYQEQPQIKIELNGKLKTYSADCFIKRCENSENRDAIVEVKYTYEIEKNKEYYEQKFTAAKKATEKLNLDFIVYTEEKHSSIHIDNLDFLYRYKTQGRDTEYDTSIKNTLGSKEISAYELAQTLSKTPVEYMKIANAIWGLVANKVLVSDLNLSELTMKSLVRVNNGSN